MKKKNAFTLIELLAVIVILAVIAVIATPIILGVIENSKKSSYIDSSHGIIDAANKFVITTELTGNLESNYEFDLTTDELTFSGNKPSSGTLLIDRVKKVSLTLKYDNYCIEKKFNESEPTIKNKANCVIDNSEVLSSQMYKERVLNGTDPVISGDLVPVRIEQVENGYKVYKSSVNDSYYSYEAKRWANAIIPLSTAKGAVNGLAVGAEISESQIESYFVWIPRYKYQLWHTTNTGTYGVDNPEHSINIMFESKDYPVSNGNNNGEWLTHPAFTSFNTNGIWVGKFETGYKGATSTTTAQVNTNDSTKVVIKPSIPGNTPTTDVYSWRYSSS